MASAPIADLDDGLTVGGDGGSVMSV